MKRSPKPLLYVLALSLMATLLLSTSASAELLKGTRLRVEAAAGTDLGTFQVFYGPNEQFRKGSLLDVTSAAASGAGLEYLAAGSGPAIYNLYIVPSKNHVVTSIQIVQGFAELYENGQFVRETTTINVTDGNLAVIRGEQLNYTDGKNDPYVAIGGSRRSSIPGNYTGPAYFGELAGDARKAWIFSIAVTTEFADSGAVTLEESNTRPAVQAKYTLDYGQGKFEGTAASVMTNFNAALDAGKIPVGTRVEISYDTNFVGGVLVKKGISGFTDPVAPNWEASTGRISFILDKEGRTIRFLYVSPPGSVKFSAGTNPFQFSTNIDVVSGQEIFGGTLEEVNQGIADRIADGRLNDGSVLTFTIQDPSNVTSVKLAEARVNVGREEAPGAFGDNILQGRGFSLKLSNERAFRIQINFRTTLGRLFLQESVQNKGTYIVEFVTGTTTSRFVQDTAAKSMEYLDGYIASGEVKLGSTIKVTFPEGVQRVTMGVGRNPSMDITGQLVNRSYSYKETTDDVTFFVFYQNSGGEIVVSPTLPLNPGDSNESGIPGFPGIPDRFDFGSLPGEGNGLGAPSPLLGTNGLPMTGNGSNMHGSFGLGVPVSFMGCSCRCCGCSMFWLRQRLGFQSLPLYEYSRNVQHA